MITVHTPYDPKAKSTRAPVFGIHTSHPDASPEILKKLEDLGGKIEEVKDKQSAHANVLSDLQSRKMPEIPAAPDLRPSLGSLEAMLRNLIKPQPLPPDNSGKIVDAVKDLGTDLSTQLRLIHASHSDSFSEIREFLSKNMPIPTPVIVQKPSRLPWLMCGAIVAIDLLGHIKW
jgi:hypothetical protein